MNELIIILAGLAWIAFILPVAVAALLVPLGLLVKLSAAWWEMWTVVIEWAWKK